MRAAIWEEWENIALNEILKIVDIMPVQIAAVLATNGGHTNF